MQEVDKVTLEQWPAYTQVDRTMAWVTAQVLEWEWWRKNYKEEFAREGWANHWNHFPFIELNGKDVIDFGSGPYSLAEKQEFKSLTCIDPLNNKYSTLELKQKKRGKYLPIRLEDYEGPKHEAGVCINVIDHALHPSIFAEKMFKHLKPGAHLYFMVNFEKGLTKPHLHVFDEGRVHEVLEPWFELIEDKVIPSPYDYIHSHYYGVWKKREDTFEIKRGRETPVASFCFFPIHWETIRKITGGWPKSKNYYLEGHHLKSIVFPKCRIAVLSDFCFPASQSIMEEAYRRGTKTVFIQHGMIPDGIDFSKYKYLPTIALAWGEHDAAKFPNSKILGATRLKSIVNVDGEKSATKHYKRDKHVLVLPVIKEQLSNFDFEGIERFEVKMHPRDKYEPPRNWRVVGYDTDYLLKRAKTLTIAQSTVGLEALRYRVPVFSLVENELTRKGVSKLISSLKDVPEEAERKDYSEFLSHYICNKGSRSPAQKGFTFLEGLEKTNVLHISRSSCAGAPFELHRTINNLLPEYTSRQVQVENHYRLYGYSEETVTQKMIDEAEIIHLHNCSEIPNMDLSQKPVVTTCHSVPRWLKEKGIELKPPLISATPLQKVNLPESVYIPHVVDYKLLARKKMLSIEPLTIAHMNASKDRDDVDKGTRQIIDICKRYNFRLEFIHDVPKEQALRKLKRCDVLVDDIISGNLHLSPLEALAMGLVVITKLSPDVKRVLETEWVIPPVINIDTTLEHVLTGLDVRQVRLQGQENAEWMRKHWDNHKILDRLLGVYNHVIKAKHKELRSSRRVSGKGVKKSRA